MSLRRRVMHTLHALGVGRRLHARNRAAGRIPIVVFHRVTPVADPFWPPYTPEQFRRIVAFLAEHYRFLAVEDLFTKPVDDLRDGIVLTFDDAWADFLHYALPVLEEFRAPVTQFLATAPLDEGRIIWTSEVDAAFRYATVPEVVLEDGATRLVLPLSTEAERLAAAVRFRNHILSLPNERTFAAVEQLHARLGRPTAPDQRLLTWEELRNLRERVHFGAHTVTHSSLRFAAAGPWLTHELEHCGTRIATELGTRPRYLAYPIGFQNAAVRAEAAKHYEAAFAVGGTPADLHLLQNDPDYRFRIPRINLTDVEPAEVWLRINGFHAALGR